MKTLLASALLVLSCAAFAYGEQVVDLNQASVLLGSLNSEQSGPANVQLTLRRTAQTPEEVKLVYSVNYYITVCAQYDVRQVWVPGTMICRDHHDGGGHHGGGHRDGYRGDGRPGHGHGGGYGGGHYGGRDCHMTPGYYRAERYCVQYTDALTSDRKDIDLEFKKANDLRGGEEETFVLSIVQRSHRSNNVDFSASALQTRSPYEIKKTLLGGGLKFKAK